MKIRVVLCIASQLFLCNARAVADQPPQASPRFVAGIEYQYGNRYAADGNFEQAIRYDRRALGIYPSPEVFSSLGFA
jgi:tetratricopeptide (TPR) repeat protein